MFRVIFFEPMRIYLYFCVKKMNKNRKNMKYNFDEVIDRGGTSAIKE